jgi:hypothetical protein
MLTFDGVPVILSEGVRATRSCALLIENLPSVAASNALMAIGVSNKLDCLRLAVTITSSN